MVTIVGYKSFEKEDGENFYGLVVQVYVFKLKWTFPKRVFS